jgi:hypothetical protein
MANIKEVRRKPGELNRTFIVKTDELMQSSEVMNMSGIPAIGESHPDTIPQRWKCWEIQAFVIARNIWQVRCLYARQT